MLETALTSERLFGLISGREYAGLLRVSILRTNASVHREIHSILVGAELEGDLHVVASAALFVAT